MKVAVLVDGGFYRKRAAHLYGHKTPEARAEELAAYCIAHSKDKRDGQKKELYRIFYYDCPPSRTVVYNPLLQKNISLEKKDTFKWMEDFLNELRKKRKFAVRLGELTDTDMGYYLPIKTTKALCSGKIKVEDLTEADLALNIVQKGVDMRVGLDIASLAYKRQVEQIILISGDSDFVPAAKLARREGIDFILDPMGASVKDDLYEHIDGLRSQWNLHKKE